MKKKIPWRSGQRILFVCYGNTCRSPIAEGLAKKILGNSSQVESAGLSPEFLGAQDDAVEILWENYRIDISGHRTQGIANINLYDYDWIIVLDAWVYNQLAMRFPSFTRDMLLWDVKDPYMQGKEAFAACAETIRKHIHKYLL